MLGPCNFDDFLDDFDEEYDKDKIPNIQKELESFAKNPFNLKEPLTLDLLLTFINYDESGKAHINDSVYVEKKENQVFIYENA